MESGSGWLSPISRKPDVNVRFDPRTRTTCVFSIAGLGSNLFVDLQIDSTNASPEKEQTLGSVVVADPLLQQNDLQVSHDEQLDARPAKVDQGQECGLADQGQECGLGDQDLECGQADQGGECSKVDQGEECAKMDKGEECGKIDQGEECRASTEPYQNATSCLWPDWGQPLPPEESDVDEDMADWGQPLPPEESGVDEDMHVDFAGVKENHSSDDVTFSDAVTFVEATSLENERETRSLSYTGASSSDDDLELGSDQVASSSDMDRDTADGSILPPCPTGNELRKDILNSADVSAACQLLELRNVEISEDSSLRQKVSDVCRIGQCTFHDLSQDLEKLSSQVEELYAAHSQLSTVATACTHERRPSQEIGTWTVIQVSKGSGKFRMKRIRRDSEAKFDSLAGLHDSCMDNDLIEKPPCKRQFKSLRSLLNKT